MNLFEKLDTALAISIGILLFFGVWIMSSVSVFNSYEKQTAKFSSQFCEQNYPEEEQSSCKNNQGAEFAQLWCSEHNCNDRFLRTHIRNVLVGIGALIIAFLMPFPFWRIIAPIGFLGGFVLLTFPLLGILTPSSGAGFTANSWIILPVVGSFQPSEAMKLGLVLYAALWMEKKKQEVETLESGFIPFVILVFFATFLVMLQPDFGSTIIILFIATSIFWLAGGALLHFVFSGVLGIILLLVAYTSFSYVRARIDTFLNPELADKDALHQIEQSYLSIGNGGFFGAGNSTQSFGFLPEIQGDMVFAAIAEQVGFIGMIFVVGLYAFITYRGIRIAKQAPNRFSMLVAGGITAWLASQSIINMMVVTGLFPLTGITLPLLSYGGSSLLMTLSGIGILLKISTLSHENTSRRRRNRRTPFSFGGAR
jgi:cell division protein FtsW